MSYWICTSCKNSWGPSFKFCPLDGTLMIPAIPAASIPPSKIVGASAGASPDRGETTAELPDDAARIIETQTFGCRPDRPSNIATSRPPGTRALKTERHYRRPVVITGEVRSGTTAIAPRPSLCPPVQPVTSGPPPLPDRREPATAGGPWLSFPDSIPPGVAANDPLDLVILPVDRTAKTVAVEPRPTQRETVNPRATAATQPALQRNPTANNPRTTGLADTEISKRPDQVFNERPTIEVPRSPTSPGLTSQAAHRPGGNSLERLAGPRRHIEHELTPDDDQTVFVDRKRKVPAAFSDTDWFSRPSAVAKAD